MDVYANAAEIVRARDRDRYVADLFAPEPLRKHLFALHAFAAEIVRVQEVVHEPALGEIRLQWWRDAIATRDGGGHPVADALIQTMQEFHLPAGGFDMLIEGRVFDLYDDPMPTLDDLDAYAGLTASSLLQLAAIVLAGGSDPGAADAAGHGGVAETIVATLALVAANPRRGAKYVPESLLAKQGANRGELENGINNEEIRRVLAELRAVARQHLAEATASVERLDRAVAPAFLPLALTSARLARMDQREMNPFRYADFAPWRRQWIMWRATRRLPKRT